MGTAKRERQKANRRLKGELEQKQQRKSKIRKRVIQAAIIIPAVFAAVYVLAFVAGGDDKDTTDTVAPIDTVAPEFVYGIGECAPDTKPAEPVRTFTDAPKQCIDPATSYSAVIETNKGSFTIALDTADSPGNVNNFVTLARYGYYDGTGCHRIMAEFVVQCGRPGEDEQAPGYNVPDELPAEGSYAEGVVAMANTGSPDSGGGQFFVITGDRGAALPASYTILGTVTEGYDTTVAALAALADPDASNGVPPLEQVDITSITITES